MPHAADPAVAPSTRSPVALPAWRRAPASGLLAGGLSALAVMGGARGGGATAAAGLNAPSHWLWGDAALRQDRADLKHTGVGAVTHFASAVLWATLYEGLRGARRRPTAANAIVDAAAVAAVAAVVDFRVVPPRLTPGFEHRLGRGALVGVYAALAAGFALASLARRR